MQRSIVTDGTTSQKATSHSCTWTWGCTCIARTPRLRSHTPPLPNTPPTPHPLCTCIGLTRSTSRSSATTSSCWAFRYSSAMPRSSRSCARPSARSSPNSAPTLINPPCAPSVLPLRPLLRPADVPLHPPLISALRCAPPLRPSAAPLRCAPPLRPSAAPLRCAPLLRPSAVPLCCAPLLHPHPASEGTSASRSPTSSSSPPRTTLASCRSTRIKTTGAPTYRLPPRCSVQSPRTTEAIARPLPIKGARALLPWACQRPPGTTWKFGNTTATYVCFSLRAHYRCRAGTGYRLYKLANWE